MSKQTTKRQHYVPQFYLRYFTNSEGLIEVLQKDSLAPIRPCSTKSRCYEKYFYGQKSGVLDDLSQAVEDAMSDVEDRFAKRYKEYCEIARKGECFSEEARHHVAAYMAIQFLRTKSTRKRVNSMVGELTKKILSMNAQTGYWNETIKKGMDEGRLSPATEAELAEARKIAISQDYDLVSDNIQHIRTILDFETFAAWFMVKDWRICLAPKDTSFVTSDNPVAEILPSQQSQYGNHIVERLHFFPLAQDILIILKRPQEQSKHTNTIVSPSVVFSANMVQLGCCVNEVYSGTRNVLEELKKAQSDKQADMIRTAVRMVMSRGRA